MSTTTKTLPACDCLNDCGDNPAVRSGKAQPCQKHIDRETKKTQVKKQMAIDPRWANIDFDKLNAELRDLRAQVGRLQAHIDRTQPVQANADGYVEPKPCTCPSGDGSLRWPCPEHPPEADCAPNHLCNGRMVHLPKGEHCDKCGGQP